MGKLINGVWVDWIEKVKVLQKVAVVDESGLLLAVKRADKEYARPGKWDLVGGSVDEEDVQRWKKGSGIGDDDDILINAIKREVKEETSLDVKKGSVRTIHAASGFSEKKGVFVLAIGYLCRVGSDRKVNLSKEHSKHKWIRLKEFKKLDVGEDGGLILSILERISCPPGCDC